MITKQQFEVANENFHKVEIADDSFIADYKILLEYHIEQLQNSEDKRDHDCDMLKVLQNNLKQAEEKPEEVKVIWQPLLAKPKEIEINGN